MKEISKLYCITKPCHDQKQLFHKIKILLDSGIQIIQYRDKMISKEHYREVVRSLKSMFVDLEAHLIVNDHIDVAVEEGLGLHLGWEDLEGYAEKKQVSIQDALIKIRSQMDVGNFLGITVHHDMEKISMVSSIVDYVGVGPIFATQTKLDAKEVVGPDVLYHICASSRIPVVAVGGITAQNLHFVVPTGASFFAMCSEIFDAHNIGEKIQQMSAIVSEYSK